MWHVIGYESTRGLGTNWSKSGYETSEPGYESSGYERSMGTKRLDTESTIGQFRYIKIQPKIIDLSTRLVGITTEFVGFIPTSLVLRSIVLGWILIYRNWAITPCKSKTIVMILTLVTSIVTISSQLAFSTYYKVYFQCFVHQSTEDGSGLRRNTSFKLKSFVVFFKLSSKK